MSSNPVVRPNSGALPKRAIYGVASALGLATVGAIALGIVLANEDGASAPIAEDVPDAPGVEVPRRVPQPWQPPQIVYVIGSQEQVQLYRDSLVYRDPAVQEWYRVADSPEAAEAIAQELAILNEQGYPARVVDLRQ